MVLYANHYTCKQQYSEVQVEIENGTYTQHRFQRINNFIISKAIVASNDVMYCMHLHGSVRPIFMCTAIGILLNQARRVS